MIESALEEIGLTKGEIRVYVALIGLGSTTVGKIISCSKVSGSKTYEVLDRLIKKGLVSYIIKGETKYFEATPPSRILDYINEKEKELNKQKEIAKKILPELKLKEKQGEKRSDAVIYKGFRGLKSAYTERKQDFKDGDDNYVMFIPEVSKPLLPFFKDYLQDLSKNNIQSKLLFNGPTEEIDMVKDIPGLQTKLSPEQINAPAEIAVHNKHVVISTTGAKDLFSIMIKNDNIAQSFKAYFESLWNQKVKVFEGAHNVTKFFTNILTELKKGEEYFVLNGNLNETVDEIRDFFPKYHEQRQKKGITINILYNHRMRKWKYVSVLSKINYKFLPSDFNSPLQTTFYKDKLYLSLWSKKPIGILIENKEIVQAYKSYFDTLWNQDITVARGITGAEDAWNKMLDELNTGEEYYVLGASWQGKTESVQKFYVDFHKRRQEKGVKAKLLFVSGSQNMLNKYPDSYKNMAEVKFLPQKVNAGMQINLYHKTVLLFVWRKEEPIVFKIEDSTVYKTFKTYFDALWNQDSITLKGTDAAKNLCDSVIEEGEDLYLIGANSRLALNHPQIAKKWHKQRIAKGITMNTLAVQSARNTPMVKEKLTKTKYLSKEFDSPLVIWIFGKKVAHVLWEKEEVIFMVENAQIADDYRKYFNALWNVAKS